MPYKTLNVSEETYELVVNLADREGRTIGKQVEVMAKALAGIDGYRIIRVDELPRPEGCDAVPLVLVAQDPSA